MAAIKEYRILLEVDAKQALGFLGNFKRAFKEAMDQQTSASEKAGAAQGAAAEAWAARATRAAKRSASEITQVEIAHAATRRHLTEEQAAEFQKAQEEQIRATKRAKEIMDKEDTAFWFKRKKIVREGLENEMKFQEAAYKQSKIILESKLKNVQKGTIAEARLLKQREQLELAHLKKMDALEDKIRMNRLKKFGEIVPHHVTEIAENITTSVEGLLSGNLAPLGAFLGGQLGGIIGGALTLALPVIEKALGDLFKSAEDQAREMREKMTELSAAQLGVEGAITKISLAIDTGDTAPAIEAVRDQLENIGLIAPGTTDSIRQLLDSPEGRTKEGLNFIQGQLHLIAENAKVAREAMVFKEAQKSLDGLGGELEGLKEKILGETGFFTGTAEAVAQIQRIAMLQKADPAALTAAREQLQLSLQTAQSDEERAEIGDKIAEITDLIHQKKQLDLGVTDAIGHTLQSQIQAEELLLGRTLERSEVEQLAARVRAEALENDLIGEQAIDAALASITDKYYQINAAVEQLPALSQDQLDAMIEQEATANELLQTLIEEGMTQEEKAAAEREALELKRVELEQVLAMLDAQIVEIEAAIHAQEMSTMAEAERAKMAQKHAQIQQQIQEIIRGERKELSAVQLVAEGKFTQALDKMRAQREQVAKSIEAIDKRIAGIGRGERRGGGGGRGGARDTSERDAERERRERERAEEEMRREQIKRIQDDLKKNEDQFRVEMEIRKKILEDRLKEAEAIRKIRDEMESFRKSLENSQKSLKANFIQNIGSITINLLNRFDQVLIRAAQASEALSKSNEELEAKNEELRRSIAESSENIQTINDSMQQDIKNARQKLTGGSGGEGGITALGGGREILSSFLTSLNIDSELVRNALTNFDRIINIIKEEPIERMNQILDAMSEKFKNITDPIFLADRSKAIQRLKEMVELIKLYKENQIKINELIAQNALKQQQILANENAINDKGAAALATLSEQTTILDGILVRRREIAALQQQALLESDKEKMNELLNKALSLEKQLNAQLQNNNLSQQGIIDTLQSLNETLAQQPELMQKLTLEQRKAIEALPLLTRELNKASLTNQKITNQMIEQGRLADAIASALSASVRDGETELGMTMRKIGQSKQALSILNERLGVENEVLDKIKAQLESGDEVLDDYTNQLDIVNHLSAELEEMNASVFADEKRISDLRKQNFEKAIELNKTLIEEGGVVYAQTLSKQADLYKELEERQAEIAQLSQDGAISEETRVELIYQAKQAYQKNIDALHDVSAAFSEIETRSGRITKGVGAWGKAMTAAAKAQAGGGQSLAAIGEALGAVTTAFQGATDAIIGTVESAGRIGALFGRGAPRAGVQEIADLTSEIGAALLNAPDPGLKTVGAILLLGAGIVNIVTDIIEAIIGKELTATQQAEMRAAQEAAITAEYQAQIIALDTLTELEERGVDQARERLDYIKRTHEAALAESDVRRQLAALSDEDIARMKQRGEAWKAEQERRKKTAEILKDAGRAEQEAFLRSVGWQVEWWMNTNALIENFIEATEADLINQETQNDLIKDEIEFRKEVLRLRKEELKEEMELLSLRGRLRFGEAGREELEAQLALQRKELQRQLADIGVDITGMSNTAIKALLSRMLENVDESQIGPEIQSIIEGWLDADAALREFIETGSRIDDMRREIRSLRRDLGEITQEEFIAEERAYMEERIRELRAHEESLIQQGAAEHEILQATLARLRAEKELKDILSEQNDELNRMPKMVTELLRARQKEIEHMRLLQRLGVDVGAKRRELMARDENIRARAREAGLSEEQIEALMAGLPAFQKGGYVPYTGPALLHAGEIVIPAEIVRQLSMANFQPAQIMAQRQMQRDSIYHNVSVAMGGVNITNNNMFQNGDRSAAEALGLQLAPIIWEQVNRGIVGGRIKLERGTG